jgi:hypothetical protein
LIATQGAAPALTGASNPSPVLKTPSFTVLSGCFDPMTVDEPPTLDVTGFPRDTIGLGIVMSACWETGIGAPSVPPDEVVASP